MKKSVLLKPLLVILVLSLALATAFGVLFLSTPAAKLLWGGLGLLGFLMTGVAYCICRAEAVQMADALESTLLVAEQGRPLDATAFSQESITHRLCLRAVRLAEVTQNKALEQEVSRAALQSAVNDLAHQLRAPVANLTLYADTLAAGGLPPEKQTEFLAILGGQARKLEFLVEALVKTGRLETGVIQMVSRTLPLKNTLEQAFSLAKPLADAKSLTFTMDCPGDLTIPHDSKWTAKAVFNLLDNAIKYTSAGCVTLTAQRWEIYTCIEVTDTGHGFIQEDAARLFSRFYRSPQAAAAPGVGLGLYIVRQIVQLQGGYVQAKALGTGSSFRLFLPNDLPDGRYRN